MNMKARIDKLEQAIEGPEAPIEIRVVSVDRENPGQSVLEFVATGERRTLEEDLHTPPHGRGVEFLNLDDIEDADVRAMRDWLRAERTLIRAKRALIRATGKEAI